MKRLNTILFVANKTEDEILKYIKDKKQDKQEIIKVLIDSRKEYGLKVQRIIEELRKNENSIE